MNVPSLSTTLLAPLATYPITVLLVDDQRIIAEAVRRMLADQKDIVFHYCSDPKEAVSMALELKPTVILQDLVMPDVEGLLLVKFYRAKPETRDIPIIVLSTKEEPEVKAEAFALGANDYVVKLPDKLELVARIRYHSNSYIRLLERNEAFKKLADSQRVLEAELAEAAAYVKTLLPPPLKEGVETEWRFIPSTALGGDAFGYHWLDDHHFAIYLLDVCGHGVGAALLSISVMNVLRSYTLPRADFYDPASVLKELNTAFPMEKHNGMFFTIWYGVYNIEKRELIYSSGGHPPALLLTGPSAETASIIELKTPGLVIGGIDESFFQNAVCKVESFNRLFVFSDGLFEVEKLGGGMMSFSDFKALLLKMSSKEKVDVFQIVQAIQQLQGKDSFVDDCSLLEVKFR